MSSAYFTDEQIKMSLSAPKKAAKKSAPAPTAPAHAAPVIDDPALAAEVAAFRESIKSINQRMRDTATQFWRPGPSLIERAGLVLVDDLGVYVERAHIRGFAATVRATYRARLEARREHLAGAIAAALIDADRDEYTALILLGLSFHDDRGDGLLWVPALRQKAAREAWARACAALKIESRARACLR